MKKSNVYIGLASLLLSLPLSAQENLPAEQTDKVEMAPMVVIASKVMRPLVDVAGSVTVITAIDIEEDVVQNMDDMLRYQPGINIDRAGTRFASEGINIRGIGGNRVAMEIDGVPVQSQFSLGSFSNTGRDTLEVDTIKRVEILSGPASTLYGSKAIGGVMAVTTLDPEDIAATNGTGWRAKAGYNSVDNSWLASGGAALMAKNSGLMAIYSHRDGNEPDTIRDLLEIDMDQTSERHKANAQIFDQMGGFSGAMGMIGTLIGLVAMLLNMSDPSAIGPSMAVALLTTMYGAMIGNIVGAPIANILLIRDSDEILVKTLIIEGIMAIQSGDNPRTLEGKLLAFLPPKERESQFN